MTRTYCIITAFFLFTTLVRAQVVINMPLEDFYREFKTNQFNQQIRKDAEIKGSPYEKDEFIPGEIVTTSHQRFSGIPLQLNIYSNQMEFKSEDGSILVVSLPEAIEYARIGQDKYIYSPYSTGNRIQKGYFRVLSEGNIILLQKLNILLKPAEEAQAYKEAVPAQFVRTGDDFYLRILPAEAKKISNKKDLAEILGNYPHDLDEFIKKNKIRFSRAEDLQKLMEYYKTLEM